jgi:hypothetical protein
VAAAGAKVAKLSKKNIETSNPAIALVARGLSSQIKVSKILVIIEYTINKYKNNIYYNSSTGVKSAKQEQGKRIRKGWTIKVVGEAPSEPSSARHPRATGDPN